MAAIEAVDGQSVATFSTGSSQSSKSRSIGARTTGRGGSGNIRQAPLPSGECFKEDKVTSPSGREMKTGRGAQAVTGRGGAGNVESTSKQRLEEARAILKKEKAILAQHKQEMRRHEKQGTGRGGAGNLQRKKNTTVSKEPASPGAQVGSKIFRTMTRSSRSSSERSVIDIANTDRDSDLWSIAESTMSRTSTAGIIISKFGESLLGKSQRLATSPPDGIVTGVCYSDASPSPKTPSRQACSYDVTSPYPPTRTPNEVAPFEEPAEPSPLAAVVFNASAAASSSRPPQQAGSSKSSRPMLKRLIRAWSTDDYPPTPRSATPSISSYPYSYDDTASFDSYQPHRTPTHSTPPQMEYNGQPATPLRAPPRRVDFTGGRITNDFSLPPIPTSASVALNMVARPPYDGDRFSDQTGVRSSGSSYYAGRYSSASTEIESRDDYAASRTPFPRLNVSSRRASTGRDRTPGSYAPPYVSTLSVSTTHSDTSIPQLESFTPTFGVKKLPSLPAVSVRSFDEFSLPSPPRTPLPGSIYSGDAYDSDRMTIADQHTREPEMAF